MKGGKFEDFSSGIFLSSSFCSEFNLNVYLGKNLNLEISSNSPSLGFLLGANR